MNENSFVICSILIIGIAVIILGVAMSYLADAVDMNTEIHKRQQQINQQSWNSWDACGCYLREKEWEERLEEFGYNE